MAEQNTAHMVERSKQAWDDKNRWTGLLDDVYKYALPMRNQLNSAQDGSGQAGQGKMDGVYSSTAINSTVKFANRLQSDLTPPFTDWNGFEPGPLIPEKFIEPARAMLAPISKRFMATVNASNFAPVVNEMYLELASGQGNMLVMPGDDDDGEILKHHCVPDSQLAYDEGAYGTIDGKFRRIPMKVRNIILSWKDAKMPPELLSQDPNKTVILDEMTMLSGGEYLYVVMYKADKRRKDGSVLVERTMTTDPWMCPRWLHVAGEVRGRGPLMTALPDILTENAVVALVLKSAAMAISGAWGAVDDGVLNPDTIVFAPGAVNLIGKPDSLVPLATGGRFDVSQLILDDLRTNIKIALYDQSLPAETATPKSATEIVERIKQLQQDIGSPFGRLMREFIVPYSNRVLDIMAKKGVIEPVKVNGLTVKAQVTSPLAMAQKLQDVQAFTQFAGIINSIQPQLLMIGTKIEDVPAWLGEKLGMDPALLRSKEESKQFQEMLGKAAAQGAEVPGGAQGGGGGGVVQPQSVAA